MTPVPRRARAGGLPAHRPSRRARHRSSCARPPRWRRRAGLLADAAFDQVVNADGRIERRRGRVPFAQAALHARVGPVVMQGQIADAGRGRIDVPRAAASRSARSCARWSLPRTDPCCTRRRARSRRRIPWRTASGRISRCRRHRSPPARSRDPGIDDASQGTFCRTNITWKSGEWLRLRAGRSASTSFSNGRSWCAQAASAVRRTRASSSRNVRVAGEVAAHQQRVGEEADQRLELRAPPAGDRRADDDVVLPGVAREEHVECREQRHEQRAALGAGERAERAR